MGYMRYRTPLAWSTPDERDGSPNEDVDVAGPMSDLAEYFPCLIGKPGVRPWDPDLLDDWADGNGATATELYATRFILHVWDGKRAWKCGQFDLVDALDFWDETHRTAFVSWVLDPWWPLSLRLGQRCSAPLRDTPAMGLPAFEPLLAETRDTRDTPNTPILELLGRDTPAAEPSAYDIRCSLR
jgi:hypothetical protein